MPERLAIRKSLIIRCTFATAYPAEIFGAPKQNFSVIVRPRLTHNMAIIQPSFTSSKWN